MLKTRAEKSRPDSYKYLSISHVDTGFLLVDIPLRKDSPLTGQKNYSSQQTLRGDRAVPQCPFQIPKYGEGLGFG